MNSLYNDGTPTGEARHGKGTLSAFFDSQSDAEQAVSRLKDAGINDVRLMPGYEADVDKAPVGGDDRPGFWVTLADWFFPDEDRAVYAEGLRRGGFLVSVEVDDANHDTALDILDDEGAIDMDERADIWRSEGWNFETPARRYAELYDGGLRDDLERIQQTEASQDDAFAANATEEAAPAGKFARRSGSPSPRVRAYEFEEELATNEELRDDILPTGHQRTVASEREDRAETDMHQSQTSAGMRQDQLFPRR